MRTEGDIRTVLLTLVPDPETDARLLSDVRRTISRRRTIKRAGVVATLAAATAASMVLALASPAAKHHSPATRLPLAGATLTLKTLAKIAAAQPAFQPPGPGQFQYSRTRQQGPYCLKPVNPKEGYGFNKNCYIEVWDLDQTRTWVAQNGSGRVLTTLIKARFASARDRAHWIAAGRPKLDPAANDLRLGRGQLFLGVPGLGKLPTDPAKLAVVIDRRQFEGGPPGPAEDFTQVADLLRFPNASSALRAAAFEVGARIPGVRSLGPVSFHGVTGVGIVFSYHPSKLRKYRGDESEYELIFDRTTSTLKAEVHSDVASGKVLFQTWVTYLASGLVRSDTSTR